MRVWYLDRFETLPQGYINALRALLAAELEFVRSTDCGDSTTWIACEIGSFDEASHLEVTCGEDNELRPAWAEEEINIRIK